MTNDEIRKASAEWQMANHPICIGGDAFADIAERMNVNPAFVAGVEWAQKQFAKEKEEYQLKETDLQETIDALENSLNSAGLELLEKYNRLLKEKQQWIEKACKFLDDNVKSYTYDDYGNEAYIRRDELIKCFKKAMEK